MGKKKILKREDSINESVVNSFDDLVYIFYKYFTATEREYYRKGLDRVLNDRYNSVIERLQASGEEVSFKMAREATNIPEGAPLWMNYGDSEEKAAEAIAAAVEKPLMERAEDFVESRYPIFRSAFFSYLEPMLLAGMREGVLCFSWYRACNYGFSVEPWKKEGEKYIPISFPYTSVEDMTEDDKRAFRWVVEDTFDNVLYYIAQRGLYLKQGDLSEEEGKALLEGRVFIYPKEGYNAEQIAKRQSFPDAPVSVSDLRKCWLYEVELSYPVILHRLDEALYFATKFGGNEYKDYIESLNVEEDFNFPYKEEGGHGEKYDTVMKEGYVWHWAE